MSIEAARAGEARARVRAYPDALLHLTALSIVAGAIHAVAAPPHFAESWPHGGFFVALAAFQFGWGVSVYARPGERAFRTGAAVSVAVMAVWIVSRTAGIPFGPHEWEAESFGLLDAAATASEALIAGLCAAFLATAGSRPAPGALPARYRYLQPLALAAMFAGLMALFVGGHHAH